MFKLEDLAKAWQRTYDRNADKRIFCDCQGTLLKGDLSLNKPVLKFLVAAKKSGYLVTLVSSRANLVQMAVEDCLEDYGLPSDHFGDVELKQDFVGKGAFIVIDDMPQTMSGVSAAHVLLPDDPRIAPMTKKLDAGQPPQSALRSNAA